MQKALLTLLLVSLFSLPTIIFATGIVPCDGIGDSKCQACSFVQLFQNLLTWFIATMASVIALVFAWGGMKMVMSQGGEGVSQAKSMMTNAIVGFVILLSAWLIIDTFLKLMIKSDSGLGVWNEIKCVEQPGYVATQAPAGVGTVSGPAGSAGTGVQCASGSVCAPSTLKSVGFTDAQANVMSCIAMTESTGNPDIVNPNGGACGTFQILPSNWSKLQSSGALGGTCSGASCTNGVCNAKAAYTLSQGRVRVGQSPYADWTCPGCNNKAQGCVTKYDPSI
jgi:hypothetical protein